MNNQISTITKGEIFAGRVENLLADFKKLTKSQQKRYLAVFPKINAIPRNNEVQDFFQAVEKIFVAENQE